MDPTTRSLKRACKRRVFLAGVALAACEARRPVASPLESPTRLPLPANAPKHEPTAAGSVPHRPLGLTEEKVSAVGLGGYHLGIPSEPEAICIMHRAIDEGITFFDNCWDYHEGESERRMGKA